MQPSFWKHPLPVLALSGSCPELFMVSIGVWYGKRSLADGVDYDDYRQLLPNAAVAESLRMVDAGDGWTAVEWCPAKIANLLQHCCTFNWLLALRLRGERDMYDRLLQPLCV